MLEREFCCCLRQWCDAMGAGGQTKNKGAGLGREARLDLRFSLGRSDNREGKNNARAAVATKIQTVCPIS